MPSGFYPALPDPVNVNPLTSLGQGIAGGQEIAGQGIKNRALGLAADQAQQEQESRKRFSETKNIDDLIPGYGPEMWSKMNSDQLTRADKLFKMVPEATPYLLNAKDTKQFDDTYEYLKKQGAPEAIIRGLKEGELPERKANLQKIANWSNQMEADRQRMVGGVAVQQHIAQAKGVSEQATIPQMKVELANQTSLLNLKNNFALTMFGKEAANAKDMQTAKFSHDIGMEKLGENLKTKLAGMGKEEDREKFLMGDMTRYRSASEAAYMKGVEEVNKLYPDTGSPEHKAAIDTLNDARSQMHNDMVDLYKPLAGKYNIPFPYQKKEVKADSDPTKFLTGAPLAQYTAAKDRIQREMPAGPARDKALQQLDDAAKNMKPAAPGV